MIEPTTEPQAGPQADLVPEDDTIIGRVFWWSIAIFFALAVATGAIIWVGSRGDSLPPALEIEPASPVATARAVEPPPVAFTRTGTAEIDFVHTNGAIGEKLLPETMGGGCAFFDSDGDGDQDLLLVNSSPWPGAGSSGPRPTSALYRNDGHGRFDDVTAGSGLDVTCYGMGAAVGDYDNDGDVDVFITAVGPDHLYRNEGGKFRDVTAEAGVAGDPDGWSTSAGFFDADNDGDLDLFVCNYVKWSREIDFAVDYRLTGIGRAYGPPTNFQGAHPSFFRNQGNGTFTDVSAPSGVQVANAATGVPVCKSLGIAFIDVGHDGFIDVLVANDTTAKLLLRNRGDGTFQEIGAEAGVAYSSTGAATGAMGVDAALYRNDSTLGFAVANFANEMTSLFVAPDGGWQFTDEAIVEGIGAPSRKVLKFGLFFFDYDLDGWLDLLQANGHIEDEINTVQPSQTYRQAPQLFYNAGRGARQAFVEVPRETTGDLAEPMVARGASYADIDGDGDLDVLLTDVAGPPRLLRNDQALGHHWLRVKLLGRTCNRDAIGAWVEVTTTGADNAPLVQRRQVMPTRSYLSQVELPVTFGLGAASRVDRLTVSWPGGDTQTVAVPGVDRLIVIEQQGPAAP